MSYTVEAAATKLAVPVDTIVTLTGQINDDPEMFDYETSTLTAVGLDVIREHLAWAAASSYVEQVAADAPVV